MMKVLSLPPKLQIDAFNPCALLSRGCWVHVLLFLPPVGRHGLRGGGGPEGSPDLLVHPEVRQGEPTATLL